MKSASAGDRLERGFHNDVQHEHHTGAEVERESSTLKAMIGISSHTSHL